MQASIIYLLIYFVNKFTEEAYAGYRTTALAGYENSTALEIEFTC